MQCWSHSWSDKVSINSAMCTGKALHIVHVSLYDYYYPICSRCLQEVHLDKLIKLLDCPGIVMATSTTDAAMILRNCVKIEQLVDPLPPVEAILRRCNKAQVGYMCFVFKLGHLVPGVIMFCTYCHKCNVPSIDHGALRSSKLPNSS